MGNVGFYAKCPYPTTGMNCTQDIREVLSPVLEISSYFGVVCYSLLTFQSIFTTKKAWLNYKASRPGAERDGRQLRFMCAISLLLGGIAAVVFCSTGINLTHNVYEPLGIMSLLSCACMIVAYCFSSGAFLLLMRNIFFSTIKFNKDKHKFDAVQKINQTQILSWFIGPLILTYLIAFILVITGTVKDTIVIIRISLCGCVLPILTVVVLNKVYGHNAVAAIKASGMTEETTTADSGNNKTVELANKLSKQLKAQDINCITLAILFTFMGVSNVMHIPEVAMFLTGYNYCLMFVGNHVAMNMFLSSKKKNNKSFHTDANTGAAGPMSASVAPMTSNSSSTSAAASEK